MPCQLEVRYHWCHVLWACMCMSTHSCCSRIVDGPHAGVCEDDIDRFCMDVMPGLGRLAICLSDQVKEEGTDGYSGSKITKECKQELDTFRKDQSGNINLDLPLGMVSTKPACSLQVGHLSAILQLAACSILAVCLLLLLLLCCLTAWRWQLHVCCMQHAGCHETSAPACHKV